MAWRLNESVVRGEIDNREPGRVRGAIWLAGRNESIVLELKGNCLRDVAGCLVAFENLQPRAAEPIHLAAVQRGAAGDITASRKVRVLEHPIQDVPRRIEDGEKPAEHWANAFYLEWFGENDGRVVIESVNYRVTVSAPAWTMSVQAEQAQAAANHDALNEWLGRIAATLSSAQSKDAWTDTSKPRDEFEWEKALRESDELTDQFCRAFNQYADHPNRDELIAREMGWDQDAAASGPHGKLPWEIPDEAFENQAPQTPNPATEGKDWIRDNEGEIHHPLCHAAIIGALAMRCTAQDRGWLEADPAVAEMLFQFQMMSAKLVGALDGLAYDDDPDCGFVVACLKRALHHLHQSMAAQNQAVANGAADREWLKNCRAVMLPLREQILAQMQRFRNHSK